MLIFATAARAASSSFCCGPQPSWRSPGAGVVGLGAAGLPDAGAERRALPDAGAGAVGDGVPDCGPEEGEGAPVQAAVASIAAVTASVVAVLWKVLV
ncbi:hypothetical protein LJR078_002932 [Arthrobacter sp. LjRoot78]|uniref:hypothetical protein n=1 Tax=Arthrobacter sp. LjRoot78 TaxID=3342338 RepID=UPI003ECC8FC1